MKQLLKPRAIVEFTFALNYKFGKLNVSGYHLVNVFIHILNGILVYFLSLTVFLRLSKMKGRSNPSTAESPNFPFPRSAVSLIPIGALFTALIFIAHPIQTQAVTYTIQRYTSTAALFYMASVLFYVKARVIQHRAGSREQGVRNGEPGAWSIEHGAKRKDENQGIQVTGLYILSILCWMLAFLSKQNTASLPGIILLVEYLFIDRTWQGWKRKIPWFVLVFVIWAFFILYVSGFFSGSQEGKGLLEDVSEHMRETETVGRWSYLCTQFNVLVIYIRLLFLPIRQNLDYLYPFKSGFFDGYTPLAFLFLAGLIALGIIYMKKRPIISFCVLWFFITLSVESSLIPIRDAIFEHRLYLPMFGFALFLVYIFFIFLSKRHTLTFLVLIVLAFGTATYLRNRVWQEKEILWSDVIEKNPRNFRGYNNLGFVLANQNRLDEAIDYYQKALEINPGYANAHNNMGNALQTKMLIDKSIKHYLAALRIKPDYAEAHNNLGIALRKQGRIDEAIRHYREALRINPTYAEAHNNLAYALQRQGQLHESIGHYIEALRIKPEFAEAHNNLGRALEKQGKVEEAIGHYREALRIRPHFIEARYNLGVALERQGHLKDAINNYLEVLRIDPNYAEAHYSMGNSLQKLGHLDEAITHYFSALRISPDYLEAHNNLGVALKKQGRLDEAIKHYSEALRIKPDYVEAHNNLGNALLGKGDIEDAILHYKEALKLKSDYINARNNLQKALILRKQKRNN